MTDKLQSAAKFYKDNLDGRKFKLIAGKKSKKIELIIVFRAEHFKHLSGLHKLKDLPVSKRDSSNVYQEILDNKITDTDIKKSRFYSEIEERLENFPKIEEALFAKDLMLKSLHGYFLGITADYLLSKNENDSICAHLFLKDNKDIVIPVTFFVRDDDKYIKNNSRWTVLSIEEVAENSAQN